MGVVHYSRAIALFAMPSGVEEQPVFEVVITTSIPNRKPLTCRCFPEKFLQLGFAGALDISQRVLFKKSHNGHFFNSLGSVSLKSIPDQRKEKCV